MTRTTFGQLPDGRDVHLFTLRNRHGMEARIITLGGIVVSLVVPDRRGRQADVVLGFDTLDGYLDNRPYFGALVGRYANRIAGGRFVLDGVAYQLATNDGPNHLHGGRVGFDKVLWRARPDVRGSTPALSLAHTSADGEEGYPGLLSVTAAYALTDANELVLEFTARTDRPTPVNLAQHSYFNLAGAGAPTILDHEITIDADRFTAIDAAAIPTGALPPVAGTPFDLRRRTRIGDRIDEDNEQLRCGRGYDHNFVLRRARPGLVHAATVVHPASGRRLDVLTTQPGVQFYSGNYLDGVPGKNGSVYAHRSGLCLETQHFPDSPNQPAFPSTILRPGVEMKATTVYRFGRT